VVKPRKLREWATLIVFLTVLSPPVVLAFIVLGVAYLVDFLSKLFS
jgi:hypothetical protein